MFELATFEDEIRVPPENIGGKKEDVVLKSLVQKYENHIIPDVGVVLAVTQVSDVKGGIIKADDPGIFYSSKFEAMLFVPKLHEVVEGTVIDITDFGVFVRFGPIDGMCHISQVINDYVSRDTKANVIVAKKTGKVLKVGDTVRARITATPFSTYSARVRRYLRLRSSKYRPACKFRSQCLPFSCFPLRQPHKPLERSPLNSIRTIVSFAISYVRL